ncbi:Gfo/Idh/MocA family protein [Lacticaseibacillus jixianensis]|uniref:Gfo/Idh/MocA family protein n=1 Tax=Lacticaseibacillus jixianensis TaxID=2486012 RepID=A0ABW4B7I7_9LACO|nr:Gfo/Idh/MocA family oxidoreductase [Lacticaseibacillus jixianensis]
MTNWGIMGLGQIARDFAAQLNRTQPVYGVASRDPAKAAQFAKDFQVVHHYASYQEMLADPQIDCVYIATVNSQHLKDIKLCLDAGKHVLCEKAIWRNYEETKAVYELAASKHLLLTEAMTIYHMPLYRKLRDLIAAGRIGNVKMIQAQLGGVTAPDPHSRFFAKALGGGAMLDIGTYDLSFIRFFSRHFGQPVSVMHKYPTGVDEMWSIALKTDDGVLANANMAFRAYLPQHAFISGDGGYIDVPNFLRAEQATITAPDGTTETITAGSTALAMAYEIADFEQALATPTAGQAFAQETLDVVRLMDQLMTQAGV